MAEDDGAPKVGRVWEFSFLAPAEWITKNKVNGTWHRQKVSALTKRWRQAMESACHNARLPKGNERLDLIRLETWARFRGRAPVTDRSNLAPTLSAVQDGLIPSRTLTRDGITYRVPGYGLIPDDRDRHLESSVISIGDPLPATMQRGHPGLLLVRITELIRQDTLF